MDGKCDFVIPRSPANAGYRHGDEATRLKHKAGPEGKACGAPATQKTSVNEDPYGAGEWCDSHAPPAAVSIAPLDPNKDHRPAPPVKKKPA